MRRLFASPLARGLVAVGLVAVGQTSSPSAQYPTQRPANDVTLRMIVLGSRDEAQHVLEQLKRGDNFVTLATTLSQDPTSHNGGLLGRVAVSDLRPELRTALQGLGVGQISSIVQIPTGFAILTVVPDAEAGPAGGATPPPSRAVVSTGSVKYVADVGGYGDASLVLQIFDKPDGWNRNPRAICQARTDSLAAAETELDQVLASGTLRTSANPFDVVQAYLGRGQLHAYHGQMTDTIAAFLHAYELAASRAPTVSPVIDEALGIAYLHKAELDSGLYHAPGDRCLLPMRPGRAIGATPDLEAAIDHFSRYLTARPDELEVKWLLNLAHMLAGTYPDKVPAKDLIPTSAWASGDDVGRFVDVATEAGLSSVAMAGASVVDDFDNDGRFDVVTSTFNACESMRFFRRTSDGLFVEQTAAAGLGDQIGGLNAVQTDYNNDGYLDILLMRGAWELPQRRSLLRNNGNGTFTDVTVASGLAAPTSSQAAVWVDVDRDGFLDLFVGNEDSPVQLFRNRHDGTFEDIAARAGVNRAAFSKGVAAADYDGDGWPDLYVSNLGGTNFLYRNNGDGTFTEVGRSAGVASVGDGFATWFFDYDNDGWQDLFVTSYYTSVDETARTYLGLPHNARTLTLYRNLGNGSFRNVTQQVGLDKVFMPMGANYGDIDNDGFLDIYLGTGNPSYASLVPNVLLRNKDGQSFVDVTTASGTGEWHKGHGVAFADLDNDGDEDLVVEVGGATPGDAHAMRLFQNPGHGNHWIGLKLVGTATNRAAIGATIAVTVETAGGRRTFHRMVTSGGSFGASPLQQHIGLGRATKVTDVDIWWPVSRTRQHFTGVGMDQVLEITELAADYKHLTRPPLPLGGSTHHDRSRTQ